MNLISSKLMLKNEPNLRYEVRMPEPQNHLFEVTLNISNWQELSLHLKMPVWTPGSYLVREYARHIQELEVINFETGEKINYQKISKNYWLIDNKINQNIQIKYKVFANELTVRTNELNLTHGYFNGAALFFYIPNLEHLSIIIKIIPPYTDWIISTALPKIEEEKNTFLATNFDTLVDSPFEVGKQKIYDFQVLGKNHQWVIYSEGNFDIQHIIEDTKKIIKTAVEIFKDLPYEEYFFLLHLSSGGFGGLEHKDCCTLNYPRFSLKNKDKYDRFMQLVAHEFFHLWNVKRIRPKELEKFDYDQENYTTSLWFCEGVTSYYDMLIPLRANIYKCKTFLKLLSNDLTKYFNTYGRHIQSLNDSSFDAWIKLYRRDAYSDNSQISYYLKGQFIALLLDLIIRENTHNKKSFDDVMVMMWQKFGKAEIGYTSNQLKEVIETIANTDLTDFFERYLNTTEELPFAQYFEPFGLEIKPIMKELNTPYLGILLKSEAGKELITFVEAKSPAAQAGIDIGDELLAIDNWKVTAETLGDRLNDYQPNDLINVAIFHQEELKIIKVKLADSKPQNYQIKIKENLTNNQKILLNGWLLNHHDCF